MSVRRFGSTGLLVPVADATQAAAYAATAREALGFRAREVVPGADTVLVDAASPDALPEIEALLATVAPTAVGELDAREVQVPVRYDGEDLAEVADLLGLSTGEVVERHAAATYRVDFLGFAPGFPYLAGLDPALDVPRLDRPRARVPAGAVGLAGGRTCVYPIASPGGWRLIGRTDLALFDPTRPDPALLRAGDRVRFVPVRG